MFIDPTDVRLLIEETAAQEIMPRFRRLANHEIRAKEGGELVTEADVVSEMRLTRLLKDLLPGSLVVGEEATAERPDVVKLLNASDPVWLIDPVDGTANFAAGRKTFAVMVALVRKSRILASWIHEPNRDRTAVAEEGSGAWIGGERLRVAPPQPLPDLRGTLHVGSFGGRELRRRVQAKREEFGALPSLRCAGAEYVRLAAGEAHYTLFTKMMPWDHAPGVLLFAEAGGWARTFDGQIYDPARRDSPGLLMANDEATWNALHAALLA